MSRIVTTTLLTNITLLSFKEGNKMEQSKKESQGMEVAETIRDGLCIVHMKDSNLQNCTFISNTNNKNGRFERIKKIGSLRMAQSSDK